MPQPDTVCSANTQGHEHFVAGLFSRFQLQDSMKVSLQHSMSYSANSLQICTLESMSATLLLTQVEHGF